MIALHRSAAPAVAALLAMAAALAACGEGSTGTAPSARPHHAAPLSTFARRGGVSLVYRARPTRFSAVTSDSIDRTMDIMRRRVEDLDVSGAEIQRSGADQIDVSLPDVENADQAQQQVGTTARLVFYDWEKSVLGPDGKPAPADQSVTGGPNAGQPGAGTQTYYEAVTRAARFPPTDEPDRTTNGLYFGVDRTTETVLCGPQESAADAREACGDDGKKPSSVVKVPRGYIIVQAEADDANKAAQAAASDAYFILKDRPALRSTDIKNPEQSTDTGAGGSGEPAVVYDFTRAGRKKWARLTRTIARRGSDQLLPGVSSMVVANHFAIVLDDKLISVPYIDPSQNPHGIDSDNGSQISGGYTIKSAQRLANLMATGPLPIKLELIRRTIVAPAGSAPAPRLTLGASFRSRCTVAWPSEPVHTTQGIRMLMSCRDVTHAYPITQVTFDDTTFEIDPSTGPVLVSGHIVGFAQPDDSPAVLRVQADAIAK
jgi:preprotein translocase subunit SecD